MSKTVVEVVSKDGEFLHENFQDVAKKVREDYRHALLKSTGALHSPNGMLLKMNVPKGHVNVVFS